ncbi:MAG: dTDP-4-dehydrorhamnose reductase [Casimicrobiaceae bacterium]
MSRPLILLTGANGQLGFELAHLLAAHATIIAADRVALDLADADAIVSAVRDAKPDLIVNAGAFTAVDLAESQTAAAFAANAHAPGVLAEEAKRVGAMLIHYSTDYVFDGTSDIPYDEAARPNPLNVYGASKLAGEAAVGASNARALIFRTSWVYGLRGKNFLLTIQRLAAERAELRIVADQTGTPNWSRTLAQATAALIARGLPYLAERAGLYHLSCAGATTWYEFARAIVSEVSSEASNEVPTPCVVPIATKEYPTPARRPAYGVLSTCKFTATFGDTLPGWRDALAACLSEGPAVDSMSAQSRS